MNATDAEGISKRAHLKQAGVPVPTITIPSAAAHVFEWFCDLSDARGGNGFSLNPVSYAEIAAWSALTGARPSPWEIKAIRAMDAAYLSELARHNG